MDTRISRFRADGPVNVARAERIASLAAGGLLALYGIRRKSAGGALAAVVGAALLERGMTGHCRVYDAVGMSTADEAGSAAATPAKRMVLVQHSHTIASDPERLYAAWRDFEGLPRFMRHLESVDVLEGGRSHWVAHAPAGRTIEWEAEITDDVPGERIAWHSIAGSEVAHAGSVRFERAPAGRGTVVSVSMEYAPPGGEVGARLARFFKEEPEKQIEEDLRHFKQWIEAGEVATTEGQPTGARALRA